MDENRNVKPASLRDLFLGALDLNPAERRAHIAAGCGADADLQERVEALLRNHVSDGFLEQAAVQPSPRVIPVSESAGLRVGRYKLVQQIGEGGMGVVYLAEQEEPVRRLVALKIIKQGMDTKNVIARFEAERQALALMEHPNIARVLDGGATQTGRPYFVMELVQGAPITDFCDRNRLDTRARLRLVIQVCRAIESAHQKGIIHRDLKPSNILVTLHLGEPLAKIIDFGIAKAANYKLTDKTVFTQHAAMIGTPAYMSPEQAEMSGMDVDTRADIYGLGVLLYELLTGSPPFLESRLRALAYGEMQRVIIEEEPDRPSKRITTLDLPRRTELTRTRGEGIKLLHGLLRGDLDCIVMKCLEKDRTRRYETASALANDILRHLTNEPVEARPPSALYRAQKLVRRNKLLVSAGAAVSLALSLGLATAAWQTGVAVRARRSAEEERDRAQTAQAQAEKAKLAAERNAYATTMVAAQIAWQNANLPHLRQLLGETRDYPEKGFEWFFWQRLSRSELLAIRDHNARISAVCFSSDGSRIASASADGTVRVWDANDGRNLLILSDPAGEVRHVAFSADERRIVGSSSDKIVRVWDSRTGERLHSFRGCAGALSKDGGKLLLAETGGSFTLRELSTRAELARLGELEEEADMVAFSPDERYISSVSVDGTIHVWKWDGGSAPVLLWTHASNSWEPSGRRAAFSPDGRQIAAGGIDRMVRIWDLASGAEVRTFSGHLDGVAEVAFSPDGRRLATASLDRTLRVWDIESGSELLTLKGHTEAVRCVAFSRDGRRVASGGDDRTIRVWEGGSARSERSSSGTLSRLQKTGRAEGPRRLTGWRSPSPDAVQGIRYSPDGQTLLTASRDGTARLWDAKTLAPIRLLRGHADVLTHANFSADGRFITTGSHDGVLCLWDAAQGTEIRRWAGIPAGIIWSRASKDGTQVLTSGTDGVVRIWNSSSGGLAKEWRADAEFLWTAEFSPDEKRVATSAADGVVRLWDAATGEELLAMRGHTGPVIPLAFSPDGSQLASGGRDRIARVWNTGDGKELFTLRGHADEVWDVGFSPDGRRLVSGSFDGTVRLWDLNTGRELLHLRGPSVYWISVAFSPDGTRLAGAGDYPSFSIWESATPGQILEWQAEEDRTMARWRAWEESMAVRPPLPSASLIKSWLILAPLPTTVRGASPRQIRLEPIPNEAQFRPSAGDAVRAGARELRWQAAEFPEGVIDFAMFGRPGETTDALAYAVCYIHSDQPQRGLRLKVGSDDSARVYLNGQLLWERRSENELMIDRDTVPEVMLNRGINILIFKVGNASGPWLGALQLTDERDQPVRGLEFTSAPK